MAAKNTKPVEMAGDLEPMLTRLKLTAIRDQLDTLLDQASRAELNLREALTMLCTAEVARKDERRIQMGMSIAKFPCVRTLEGFEYDAQPSVDPKQIRELATSRWVANGDSEKLLHFTKPKLLVVDELGYLPFEANAAHLFFQLVSRRYERGSMLVTSNRSVAEWGGVFGDAVVATAILHRLLHHSHVITIRGDSYRLRTKRRAGLVNQAGAKPATTTN